MNYLGRLHGSGLLVCGDIPIARTEYDLEGYLSKAGAVTGCGEVCLPRGVQKGQFGRADLELRTDEGPRLMLRFSDKRLPSAEGAVHVDLVGGLPTAETWRSGCARPAFCVPEWDQHPAGSAERIPGRA